MRIFILHNRIETNTYAESLFRSLILLLHKINFIITEVSDVKEISGAAGASSNSAVVFHTHKKQPSFFSSINLKAALKKSGFQYLIQFTDGKMISSQIPQLIISNAAENFINQNFSPSIKIAVSSRREEQKHEEKNSTAIKNLMVIPASAEAVFQPVSWSEQQSVKIEYTQGREYFLTHAKGKTLSSFTELLKAFSTFKKWQLSSMKLVVTGALFFADEEEWNERISTYRFRDDVVLLNTIPEQKVIDLLATAYGFIHIPVADNDVIPLLQAMQCDTPCLSFYSDIIEEYTAGSAILVEKDNYEQLSEKMIVLYKDESLRSRLIAKGNEVIKRYSNENAMASLEQAILLSLH